MTTPIESKTPSQIKDELIGKLNQKAAAKLGIVSPAAAADDRHDAKNPNEKSLTNLTVGAKELDLAEPDGDSDDLLPTIDLNSKEFEYGYSRGEGYRQYPWNIPVSKEVNKNVNDPMPGQSGAGIEESDEEDYEDEIVHCPQCDDHSHLLGYLGNTGHFRCRACGAQFSHDAKPVSEGTQYKHYYDGPTYNVVNSKTGEIHTKGLTGPGSIRKMNKLNSDELSAGGAGDTYGSYHDSQLDSFDMQVKKAKAAKVVENMTSIHKEKLAKKEG